MFPTTTRGSSRRDGGAEMTAQASSSSSSPSSNPWSSFVHAFYSGLATLKLLHCSVKQGIWLDTSHAVVLSMKKVNKVTVTAATTTTASPTSSPPTTSATISSAASAGSGSVTRQQQQLVKVMLREKVCVVSVPFELAHCLLDVYQICKHRLDTLTIARHFCAGGNHPALDIRDDAIFLFNYLMASTVPNESLLGLPMVPLMDNTLGMLSTSVTHFFSQVPQYRSMGFSLRSSVAALAQQPRKNGLDPMEWLMNQENQKSSTKISLHAPIFVTTSNDDLVQRLLSTSSKNASTKSCLLETQFLTDITLDRLRTLDSHKFPGKKALASMSNMLLMEPKYVAMLLPESFPPEWSSLDEVVQWHSTGADSSSKHQEQQQQQQQEQPTKEWMHMLWDYLLTMNPQMISKYFDNMVFLPTAEGTLSRLRPTMPVLLTWPDEEEESASPTPSSASSNSSINSILRLLGVRTVDADLYQKGNIKMLSPKYLMRPSRSGILSALLERTKGSPEKFLQVFDVLDDQKLSLFKTWTEREEVRTLQQQDVSFTKLGQLLFVCLFLTYFFLSLVCFRSMCFDKFQCIIQHVVVLR